MNFIEQASQKIFGNKEKKLEQASDQSNEELKLAGFIKGKVDEIRGQGARVAQEAIWMTNVAYLLGYDSIVYNAQIRRYENTDGARFLKRNRIHVNKILPTINNRLARLCKSAPKWDVMPESSRQEDKDAARLGKILLENIWDEHRINQKRLNLMMQVQQFGYAFMKVVWDDQKGKRVPDPSTGDSIYEGDLRIEICSPLSIFVDPLARTMEEAQFVVQAKVRKLDYFRQHYPERGHMVKEEGAWLISIQNENRINSMNNQSGATTNTQMQMDNAAIELTYYEKPSSKHPEGRHVIIANGVVLLDKDLPINEIPIVKFDDVIIGDRFASESIITHMRPVQDQYNRTIRRRADWVNRLLAGKYTAPKGHGMSSESMNNESGEIVQYNHQPTAPDGGRPVPMPVPQIPSYAYEEEDRLQNMMFDIAGINEISRGQLPAAGIPAVGMQFLMEQDDTRIGVITESNEYSWADFGRMCLKFYASYAVTPRLYRQISNLGEAVVSEFRGEDLKGNVNVKVIRGSTLPGSKVLKRQEIINAYQQGLLGDPADPKLREKVLSMLEYGDVAEMWQDIAVDMAQIKTDIQEIEKGEVPGVHEMDNHPLHIQEKNRYRKGDKFKVLEPEKQAILLANIEEHLKQTVELASPSLKMDTDMTTQMADMSEQLGGEMGQETEGIPSNIEGLDQGIEQPNQGAI